VDGRVKPVHDDLRLSQDSFAFKSTLRHAFRNPGLERCEILWVNTVKPSEVRNGA
jgi:hypothetical protein